MEFTEDKSSSKNATQSVPNSKAKEWLLATQAAQRRGAREDTRRDMEDYATGLSRESLRADWEAEGERRTFHSRMRREAEKARGAEEAELQERRGRLYDLLIGEEEQYLREAMEIGRGEDPDAKWDRMLDRYMELKTKKEEERQRVAQEKRELQFRLNCDDLRQQLSRRLQAEVAADSKMAASESKNRRTDDDEAYTELWRRDEDAKRRREEDEERERRRKAVEVKKEVAEQMEEKKGRRWREILEKETDAEKRAEHNRLLALEAECDEEARRRKKDIVRHDLDECLKSKMRLKAQETQDDVMQDIFFLTQAMGDEEDKMAKKEAKRRLMREQHEFLECIREAGRRRNAEESEVERICQEAMRRQAEKQQEDRKEVKGRTREKTEEASKVIRQQMADNLERLRRIHSSNKELADKVLERDEEDKKKDEEKKRRAREANLKYQNELIDQMEIKKNKMEQEWNLNNLELERLREAEVDEDIKIRHLVEELKIDHEHPYRKARRTFFNDCGDGELQ